MGVKVIHAAKTVTTAGTRVQLTSTALTAPSVYIEAKTANTGVIYVGNVAVASTTYMASLAAGKGIAINGVAGGTGGEIALNAIYLDSSVNGEGAMWSYVPRTGSAEG